MSKNEIISQNFSQNQETYLRYALKLTKNTEEAEDLIQTAIYLALKNSDRFVDTNLNGFFYTIIKNTFINSYRKNKKKEEYHQEQNTKTVYEILSASDINHAEGNMNLELINKAITNINGELAKPFLLYYEGYKYDEISDMLKIPMGTVKTRIRACRIKLIKELQTFYPNRKANIKNVG